MYSMFLLKNTNKKNKKTFIFGVCIPYLEHDSNFTLERGFLLLISIEMQIKDRQIWYWNKLGPNSFFDYSL